MAAFSLAPAENLACFEAAMASGSPVFGLRPVRAARSPTEKLPKPIRLRASPLARTSVMISVRPSTARPASALERSHLAARASISSVLFMFNPMKFKGAPIIGRHHGCRTFHRQRKIFFLARSGKSEGQLRRIFGFLDLLDLQRT